MAPALSDLQPQSAPKATAAAQAAIGDGLVAEAQTFADELAVWRHDLHQMPELGNNLPQTSAFIQARLDEMDIPYAVLVDGSCVVGLIGAGAAAAAAGFGASGFERILPISIVRKMMQVRPTNVTPIPMITTNALETCIGGYAPFMYSGAIIARRICISTVWKSS